MPKKNQNFALSHLAVSFKSSVNLCILKSIFHLNICIQYNHFFRRFAKWKLILALISSYPLIWEASTLQISLSGELFTPQQDQTMTRMIHGFFLFLKYIYSIWKHLQGSELCMPYLVPRQLATSQWFHSCVNPLSYISLSVSLKNPMQDFLWDRFPTKISIVPSAIINQTYLIIFQTTPTTQAISGSRISAICASSQFSLNRTTQGNNVLTSNWSMSQGWIVNKIIYIGSICMIFVVLYLRLVPGSFWRTLEWTKHYS